MWHVGKREESLFFLKKRKEIRLSVNHKKRKNREKGKLEREAPPSLYIFRRSDHRSPVKHEGKSFLVTRATSRDRNRELSTNSMR